MSPFIYAGLTEEKQISFLLGTHFIEPNDIITGIAELMGINYSDIHGNSRKDEFVMARQICIGLIALNFPHLTLKEIGGMFNNRHHATILYSIDEYKHSYTHERKFRNMVLLFKNQSNHHYITNPN